MQPNQYDTKTVQQTEGGGTVASSAWLAIVKETPKTNAAILEASQYYQPLYPSVNGRNQAVHATFAKEMETDAREYKLELARALERETKLRQALSLARQYIAGEFGFENWRIEKVDEMANGRDERQPPGE